MKIVLPSVYHHTFLFQLVWRSTTTVGCGIATKTSLTILVCRYLPRGNKFTGKEVRANIPRVKKSKRFNYNKT